MPAKGGTGRFVVIGAGAVGGVVGGRLQQYGHEVIFVTRGPHGARMATHGLAVVSPDDVKRLKVNVVASPERLRIRGDDVVLLAVKSQDTVFALDALRAAGGHRPPVICLRNGMNNEREALRRFSHVYSAVVMCPTAHLAIGEVRAYCSPITGIVDVGRFPRGVDALSSRVTAALRLASFCSVQKEDIARWKWAKLLRNLGNAIEAVCGPPAAGTSLGNMVRQEAEEVLAAAGIDFASPAEEVERKSHLLPPRPIAGEARPGGSSWQSLARGTGTVEADVLNGEVVMLGRLYGVPTPINEALVDHARRMARTGIRPGAVDAQHLMALRS